MHNHISFFLQLRHLFTNKYIHVSTTKTSNTETNNMAVCSQRPSWYFLHMYNCVTNRKHSRNKLTCILQFSVELACTYSLSLDLPPTKRFTLLFHINYVRSEIKNSLMLGIHNYSTYLNWCVRFFLKDFVC